MTNYKYDRDYSPSQSGQDYRVAPVGGVYDAFDTSGLAHRKQSVFTPEEDQVMEMRQNNLRGVDVGAKDFDAQTVADQVETRFISRTGYADYLANNVYDDTTMSGAMASGLHNAGLDGMAMWFHSVFSDRSDWRAAEAASGAFGITNRRATALTRFLEGDQNIYTEDRNDGPPTQFNVIGNSNITGITEGIQNPFAVDHDDATARRQREGIDIGFNPRERYEELIEAMPRLEETLAKRGIDRTTLGTTGNRYAFNMAVQRAAHLEEIEQRIEYYDKNESFGIGVLNSGSLSSLVVNYLLDDPDTAPSIALGLLTGGIGAAAGKGASALKQTRLALRLAKIKRSDDLRLAARNLQKLVATAEARAQMIGRGVPGLVEAYAKKEGLSGLSSAGINIGVLAGAMGAQGAISDIADQNYAIQLAIASGIEDAEERFSWSQVGLSTAMAATLGTALTLPATVAMSRSISESYRLIGLAKAIDNDLDNKAAADLLGITADPHVTSTSAIPVRNAHAVGVGDAVGHMDDLTGKRALRQGDVEGKGVEDITNPRVMSDRHTSVLHIRELLGLLSRQTAASRKPTESAAAKTLEYNTPQEVVAAVVKHYVVKAAEVQARNRDALRAAGLDVDAVEAQYMVRFNDLLARNSDREVKLSLNQIADEAARFISDETGVKFEGIRAVDPKDVNAMENDLADARILRDEPITTKAEDVSKADVVAHAADTVAGRAGHVLTGGFNQFLSDIPLLGVLVRGLADLMQTGTGINAVRRSINPLARLGAELLDTARMRMGSLGGDVRYRSLHEMSDKARQAAAPVMRQISLLAQDVHKMAKTQGLKNMNHVFDVIQALESTLRVSGKTLAEQRVEFVAKMKTLGIKGPDAELLFDKNVMNLRHEVVAMQQSVLTDRWAAGRMDKSEEGYYFKQGPGNAGTIIDPATGLPAWKQIKAGKESFPSYHMYHPITLNAENIKNTIVQGGREQILTDFAEAYHKDTVSGYTKDGTEKDPDDVTIDDLDENAEVRGWDMDNMGMGTSRETQAMVALREQNKGGDSSSPIDESDNKLGDYAGVDQDGNIIEVDENKALDSEQVDVLRVGEVAYDSAEEAQSVLNSGDTLGHIFGSNGDPISRSGPLTIRGRVFRAKARRMDAELKAKRGQLEGKTGDERARLEADIEKTQQLKTRYIDEAGIADNNARNRLGSEDGLNLTEDMSPSNLMVVKRDGKYIIIKKPRRISDLTPRNRELLLASHRSGGKILSPEVPSDSRALTVTQNSNEALRPLKLAINKLKQAAMDNDGVVTLTPEAREKLSDGIETAESFIESYPHLSDPDAQAKLTEARELLDRGTISVENLKTMEDIPGIIDPETGDLVLPLERPVTAFDQPRMIQDIKDLQRDGVLDPRVAESVLAILSSPVVNADFPGLRLRVSREGEAVDGAAHFSFDSNEIVINRDEGLGDPKTTITTILHEIGHAATFTHLHSRGSKVGDKARKFFSRLTQDQRAALIRHFQPHLDPRRSAKLAGDANGEKYVEYYTQNPDEFFAQVSAYVMTEEGSAFIRTLEGKVEPGTLAYLAELVSKIGTYLSQLYGSAAAAVGSADPQIKAHYREAADIAKEMLTANRELRENAYQDMTASYMPYREMGYDLMDDPFLSAPKPAKFGWARADREALREAGIGGRSGMEYLESKARRDPQRYLTQRRADVANGKDVGPDLLETSPELFMPFERTKIGGIEAVGIKFDSMSSDEIAFAKDIQNPLRNREGAAQEWQGSVVTVRNLYEKLGKTPDDYVSIEDLQRASAGTALKNMDWWKLIAPLFPNGLNSTPRVRDITSALDGARLSGQRWDIDVLYGIDNKFPSFDTKIDADEAVRIERLMEEMKPTRMSFSVIEVEGPAFEARGFADASRFAEPDRVTVFDDAVNLGGRPTGQTRKLSEVVKEQEAEAALTLTTRRVDNDAIKDATRATLPGKFSDDPSVDKKLAKMYRLLISQDKVTIDAVRTIINDDAKAKYGENHQRRTFARVVRALGFSGAADRRIDTKIRQLQKRLEKLETWRQEGKGNEARVVKDINDQIAELRGQRNGHNKLMKTIVPRLFGNKRWNYHIGKGKDEFTEGKFFKRMTREEQDSLIQAGKDFDETIKRAIAHFDALQDLRASILDSLKPGADGKITPLSDAKLVELYATRFGDVGDDKVGRPRMTEIIRTVRRAVMDNQSSVMERARLAALEAPTAEAFLKQIPSFKYIDRAGKMKGLWKGQIKDARAFYKKTKEDGPDPDGPRVLNAPKAYTSVGHGPVNSRGIPDFLTKKDSKDIDLYFYHPRKKKVLKQNMKKLWDAEAAKPKAEQDDMIVMSGPAHEDLFVEGRPFYVDEDFSYDYAVYGRIDKKSDVISIGFSSKPKRGMDNMLSALAELKKKHPKFEIYAFDRDAAEMGRRAVQKVHPLLGAPAPTPGSFVPLRSAAAASATRNQPSKVDAGMAADMNARHRDELIGNYIDSKTYQNEFGRRKGRASRVGTDAIKQEVDLKTGVFNNVFRNNQMLLQNDKLTGLGEGRSAYLEMRHHQLYGDFVQRSWVGDQARMQTRAMMRQGEAAIRGERDGGMGVDLLTPARNRNQAEGDAMSFEDFILQYRDAMVNAIQRQIRGDADGVGALSDADAQKLWESIPRTRRKVNLGSKTGEGYRDALEAHGVKEAEEVADKLANKYLNLTNRDRMFDTTEVQSNSLVALVKAMGRIPVNVGFAFAALPEVLFNSIKAMVGSGERDIKDLFDGVKTAMSGAEQAGTLDGLEFEFRNFVNDSAIRYEGSVKGMDQESLNPMADVLGGTKHYQLKKVARLIHAKFLQRKQRGIWTWVNYIASVEDFTQSLGMLGKANETSQFFAASSFKNSVNHSIRKNDAVSRMVDALDSPSRNLNAPPNVKIAKALNIRQAALLDMTPRQILSALTEKTNRLGSGDKTSVELTGLADKVFRSVARESGFGRGDDIAFRLSEVGLLDAKLSKALEALVSEYVVGAKYRFNDMAQVVKDLRMGISNENTKALRELMVNNELTTKDVVDAFDAYHEATMRYIAQEHVVETRGAAELNTVFAKTPHGQLANSLLGWSRSWADQVLTRGTGGRSAMKFYGGMLVGYALLDFLSYSTRQYASGREEADEAFKLVAGPIDGDFSQFGSEIINLALRLPLTGAVPMLPNVAGSVANGLAGSVMEGAGMESAFEGGVPLYSSIGRSPIEGVVERIITPFARRLTAGNPGSAAGNAALDMFVRPTAQKHIVVSPLMAAASLAGLQEASPFMETVNDDLLGRKPRGRKDPFDGLHKIGNRRVPVRGGALDTTPAPTTGAVPTEAPQASRMPQAQAPVRSAGRSTADPLGGTSAAKPLVERLKNRK